VEPQVRRPKCSPPVTWHLSAKFECSVRKLTLAGGAHIVNVDYQQSELQLSDVMAACRSEGDVVFFAPGDQPPNAQALVQLQSPITRNRPAGRTIPIVLCGQPNPPESTAIATTISGKIGISEPQAPNSQPAPISVHCEYRLPIRI
jgi:hypothetical protein